MGLLCKIFQTLEWIIFFVICKLPTRKATNGQADISKW